MKLFAIHAPLGRAASEGPEAAQTGFCVPALIFGPLWLLARGLWLALSGYALGAVVVAALVGAGLLHPGAALALFGLGQLYLAIEGRTLAMVARARSGRPLVDIVCAGSALEAEMLHLVRAQGRQSPASRGAAAASGQASGQTIVGLFPEAGR